ncbi:hypothetical protein ACFW04_007297 [Cataglyphis niger]
MHSEWMENEIVITGLLSYEYNIYGPSCKIIKIF